MRPKHAAGRRLVEGTVVSPPVLASPGFNKVFLLYEIASGGTLGAVLAQEHEGREKPAGVFSGVLTAQECNYPFRGKEILSAGWAIEQPRTCDVCLILRTDHQSVTFLKSTNFPEDSARARCRSDYLQGYEFHTRAAAKTESQMPFRAYPVLARLVVRSLTSRLYLLLYAIPLPGKEL